MTVTPVPSPAAGTLLMERNSATSALVYSWHDFIDGPGRGVVVTGAFDNDEPPKTSSRLGRAISADRRAISPISLQTRLTGRAVNVAYRLLNRSGVRRAGLMEAFFPTLGKEAYFKLFGRPGFHEYQTLVPSEAISEYVAGVRAAARRHHVPILLASGKSFGGEQTLLRFSGEGACFAVNVPRTRNSMAFMAEVDAVVVALGGRPNIIKDSRLPRDIVEASYPEADRFRRLLRSWDPDRMFQSELSERLSL